MTNTVRKKISGIYLISTPNGSKYVGSSIDIHRRWKEHRSQLNQNMHHSKSLQSAWKKHGGNLKYEIIFECEAKDFNEKEQFFIDELDANLNTYKFVANMWCNQEFRDRMIEVYKTEEYQKFRSDLGKRNAEKTRRPIDCSNGIRYESQTAAAQAFGVGVPHIKHAAKVQRLGVLGVRFKFADEEWREVTKTRAQQAAETRMKNNYKHSDEAKKKMSEAKKDFVPCNKGVPASQETKNLLSFLSKTKNPVVDKKTGVVYASVNIASKELGIPRTTLRRHLDGQRYFDLASMVEYLNGKKM